MPYEISWYAPKQIIQVGFSGHVDMQELGDAHMIVTQLAQETRNIVHVILDMRNITSFPTSLMTLSRVLGTVDNRRFGWILIVSDDPVLRFLLTTLGKLMKARTRIFNEEESAFDFLAIADNLSSHRLSTR